ncbi:MAG: regulatory protein RecX [Oscillospiraceae bacterium]|nr:regulatory protein RecX [Oscillospiraceae bacterium]
MRIEKVAAQPDRAGRYTVKLDDGSSLRLYRQTVEDFAIYSGKELEEAEFDRLRAAAEEMSAKMRAVRIISASSVSKGDLERRLIQKGESKQNACQAVQWLAERSLLDDRATAQQIVQNCISKGYGPARAKQALYEKRIPKEYWDDALADYPDQTEEIMNFLQAKLGSHWEQKDLRRTIDALLRRGHSYGAVRKALNMFSENVDWEEENYG